MGMDGVGRDLGRIATAVGCLIFLAGFALALVLALLVWGCAPKVCRSGYMSPEVKKVCEGP